jgi:hypothetical protein
MWTVYAHLVPMDSVILPLCEKSLSYRERGKGAYDMSSTQLKNYDARSAEYLRMN